jgi:sulfur-oxidizing protein SoxY
MTEDHRMMIVRRTLLLGVAAAVTLTRIPAAMAADDAQAERAAAAILQGREAVEDDGLTLELPTVAENGAQVPLTVRVDNPMTADDHVSAIHVISTLNPAPDIGTFRLTPALGRAEVFTRIRLAEAQKIIVLAELSDGRVLQAAADVIVSVGGCAT